MVYPTFQIDDPYLDVPRACICVQTLLEKFANRQLTMTESWEKWRTTIEILREKRIEHQRRVEESTRVSTHVFSFTIRNPRFIIACPFISPDNGMGFQIHRAIVSSDNVPVFSNSEHSSRFSRIETSYPT